VFPLSRYYLLCLNWRGMQAGKSGVTKNAVGKWGPGDGPARRAGSYDGTPFKVERTRAASVQLVTECSGPFR